MCACQRVWAFHRPVVCGWAAHLCDVRKLEIERVRERERDYWSSRGLTKNTSMILPYRLFLSLSISFPPLYFEKRIEKQILFFSLFNYHRSLNTNNVSGIQNPDLFSPFTCCMQMLSNVYVCVNDLALVVTEEEVIWNPSRGMYQQVILPSHFF